MPRRIVRNALIALGLMACASLSFAAGAGPGGASAPAGHASTASTASKKAVPAKPAPLIDINSASRAQLKSLPGIGDAEADRIIAGRPYLSKVHLVTRVGMPAGTYQSIRHRIVALQSKEALAKVKAQAAQSR